MKLAVRKNDKKMTLFLIVLIVWCFTCGYIFNILINKDKKANNYETTKIKSTSYAEDVENIKEKSNSLADTIEKTTKSIVGISKLKNAGNSIFNSSDVGKIGLGTGVIVGENGYILSNEHLTGERFSRCYITLEDGRNFEGTVVWSDVDLDLSIVKINAKELPTVLIGDSNSIRVGESVYAIGNPIGFEFRRTVTSGIISAKNRTIKIDENSQLSYMTDLIQTDATINPGNSGGPLIYPNGEVIGINTVKISSAEGIGFAVPINVVKNIIRSFNEEDKFEEATIGIAGYDREVIPYLTSNINFSKGIYVAKIDVGGPASNTELKEGDIINSCDGVEVNTMNEFKELIYTKKTGDVVLLKINRGKVNRDIYITLGKK